MQKEAKLVVPTKYRSGTCKWFQQNEDLAHVSGSRDKTIFIRCKRRRHSPAPSLPRTGRGDGIEEHFIKDNQKILSYIRKLSSSSKLTKSSLKIIAKDRQKDRDVGALYQRQPEAKIDLLNLLTMSKKFRTECSLSSSFPTKFCPDSFVLIF